MALHFDAAEFLARRTKTLEAMAARNLDALLLFKQESMYWLTGYDSFGYCFFQCLVLRADGSLVLLTRAPDLRQAQRTSTDRGHPDLGRPRGQRPGAAAARLARRARASPEKVSASSTTATGSPPPAAGGSTRRSTASPGDRCLGARRPATPDQVAGRDRVRPPRGRARRRRARGRGRGDPRRRRRGRDPRRDAGRRASGAAATTRATHSSSARGRDALLCRYKWGRRKLDAQDQLTLEFAGVWRQYTAA